MLLKIIKFIKYYLPNVIRPYSLLERSIILNFVDCNSTNCDHRLTSIVAVIFADCKNCARCIYQTDC